MDCIFCKIANKEIPSDIIYEDESLLVFKDINPLAPVHLLVVPKVHINSLNDISESNSSIVSKIFELIPQIAKEMKINETGYRVISNCGKDGDQTVEHLHYHILGGRKLDSSLG